MFKKFAQTALKGFAKKQSKSKSRSQKLFERHMAQKKKKLRKENMKVAGLGAGMTGLTGAYVGGLYFDNLKKYPDTGKNLKKTK